MAKSAKTTITPPTTKKSLEDKLINLTLQAVEKDLQNGTATSQIKAHFLKLGTVREEKELEKLKLENALLQAKINAEMSNSKLEDMYEGVIKALQAYTPPDYTNE